MVIEIVVPEGLLDHQQIEFIEGGEVGGVAKPIGGVGVATEHDSRITAAHALEDFHIPARLALELDALITGGQFPFDDVHQLWNRALNAQRDAAGNGFAHAAEKLGERDAFALRLEVPNGIFKRSLGHLVATHPVKDARALAAMFGRFSGQHGAEFVEDDLPGRIGGFS